MKSELEEPLAAFAGGMKERRKIVQNTVEKLLKTKIQQTQQVNKVSLLPSTKRAPTRNRIITTLILPRLETSMSRNA